MEHVKLRYAKSLVRLILGACLLIGAIAQAQNVAKISVSPSTVHGGSKATGTVTLSKNAPHGGVAVTLGSSQASVTVPATVTVPSGASSATFSITTGPVVSDVTATVTGSLGNSTASATLTVTAPKLVSISFNPSTVSGGSYVTGTVTIDGPEATFLTANLSADNPALTMPATVSFYGTETSTTFFCNIADVKQKTMVTVKATLGSITKSTTLTITPISLKSVELGNSPILGGEIDYVDVWLTGNTTSDLTISLRCDNPTVTVPKTVTVTNAYDGAFLKISTTAVSSAQTATIVASYAGVEKSATLSILPADKLSSLTFAVGAVFGGQTNDGLVKLAAPAGPNGIVVNLKSNNSCATVPATVTVPAGALQAGFNINASVVTKETPVTITASIAGSTISSNFDVLIAFQFACAPNPIVSTMSTTGTITLASPAPKGGMTFKLSAGSFSSDVKMPATVTIPGGATGVSFKIQTASVPNDSYVDLGATDEYGGRYLASLTVLATWELSLLELSSYSVVGGSPSTVTVNVNFPAPVGGLIVSLYADSPLVSVPPTVTIPAGQSSATVTAKTSVTNVFTGAKITAALGASNSQVQMAIGASIPGITYVILGPSGSVTSNGSAVSSGGQVGTVTIQSNSHAAFWTGTSSSLIDLHPSGWASSYASGIFGNFQVGGATDAQGNGHAAAWNGTASSFMDLNPTGSTGSFANAVFGDWIVGGYFATSPSNEHAVLWVGSAGNFVDLNPTGSNLSLATATDGVSIVGAAMGGSDAALWLGGTSAGFVDLMPGQHSQFGYSYSIATGVSGNTQVGWNAGALINLMGDTFPYGPYPARWQGSSGTYRDLTPPIGLGGTANAVAGDVIVGQWLFPGGLHAGLWSGTDTDFYDLQAAVGGTWQQSSANAVFSDSTGVYVVGTVDGKAILWHIPTGTLPHFHPVEAVRIRPL